MQRTLSCFIIALLGLCCTSHAAKEILLRLQPAADAPVIAKITASEKVILAKEEWATVRFRKDITGYFVDDSKEEVAIDYNVIQMPLVSTEPAPTPVPIVIPAPRARINPDEPIGQLDPNALPAENVVWKPLSTQNSPPPTVSKADTPHSPVPTPHSSTIMVSAAQTQASEAAPELPPAKTPRLLTGTLVREINVDGPGYPIRLKSPEGRLIAYVDFSGIYISDLSPYIGQKVYLRGQIYPLPDTAGQLVILAESLRLAN